MNAVTKPATTQPDADRAARFEERFVNALNEGGVLLMTALGHRLGLFESLYQAEPMTSEALASARGLNERYVREWLGAMVAGRILEMDPDSNRYWLPLEHASVLTSRGDANLAVYSQFITGLAALENDILHCFRHGGGVPYERFERFHEVMAEDSGQTVLAALFDHILPIVEGILPRLEQGIRVLDLGCGRGLALMKMAARFPASDFTGIDLSDEAIDWARQEAERRGLTNLRFEARDLSDFDQTAPEQGFEFITTFDAIHDQARPLNVLRGIRRALTADGVYLAQDIRASSHHHQDAEHPLGAFLYAVSCMHCMTVSLAQGGEGLGTMWGRQRALDYMRRAGFSVVEVHELEHDIQNDYFVCRP